MRGAVWNVNIDDGRKFYISECPRKSVIGVSRKKRKKDVKCIRGVVWFVA
jgi:hypothetical protein